MTDRFGQRVFITVSLAVMCVAAAMFFFTETPADDAKTPNLRAQVIIPRTSSNRKSPPVRSAGKQNGATDHDDDIWQLIYDGNRRIGFSRTTFRTTLVAGETKIHSSSEVQMSVLRFRRTLRLRVKRDAVETPSGDLLSFRIETGSGGPARSIVTGRVAGDRLIVETKSGGITKRTSYPWRAGIKSPAYQHRLFRSSPMKPGEIRRFETFLPRLGHTTEIRLKAEGYRRVRLRNGKHGRLLRVRVTQSIRPADSVYVYLDERGRLAISESEFIGKSMVHYTVSTAVAMNAIAGAELDIRLGALIRTSFIRNALQRRKIVYRIQSIGGDPSQFLPEGQTQRVRKIDFRTIEITVFASKLPRSLRLVRHVRTSRKFTAPSRFLQTNDVRVREHARRAAGYETNPARIATKMERYVREKVSNKSFSTAMASAAEVAKHMQGDCTEHAVLLAAMLRVRRIPSRIAVGLVYEPKISSFGAHMWTEVRLGENWIPLDATLGQGGTGPTHIKLADASFADNSPSPITVFVPLMNVLGNWRIEVRKVE